MSVAEAHGTVVVVACGLQSAGSIVMAEGLSWTMAELGQDLPRSGIEPVLPELAVDSFFTTGPLEEAAFYTTEFVVLKYEFILGAFTSH